VFDKPAHAMILTKLQVRFYVLENNRARAQISQQLVSVDDYTEF
jgi:hypothetical protein